MTSSSSTRSRWAPPARCSSTSCAISTRTGESLAGADVLRFLESRVAKWWLPDDVVFVDQLPHTATGKLHKAVLREQFRDYRFADA